ncbi:alpha/beta fold hydrolase [Streptomyces sp. x-80]|uniref:alpha/beta fold hydrolase n=1 Tax=Streptomyces sp. x-80 TaxID=2789282 RepID=UPI00397F0C7C
MSRGTDCFAAQRPPAGLCRLELADRRGCGDSPDLARSDYAIDVEDIGQLLGDGAHLVGHSYGAAGAMPAASARPAAVRSLPLIEPSPLRTCRRAARSRGRADAHPRVVRGRSLGAGPGGVSAAAHPAVRSADAGDDAPAAAGGAVRDARTARPGRADTARPTGRARSAPDGDQRDLGGRAPRPPDVHRRGADGGRGVSRRGDRRAPYAGARRHPRPAPGASGRGERGPRPAVAEPTRAAHPTP